jgi:inositol-1,3,4-trisphosphate 5/6-kinase/inositol-tetrakisphosphate 1-kinase
MSALSTNNYNYSNWEDNDSVLYDNDNQSHGSSPYHEPIVVAYAFGPKKMKSMGLVMAEASRVPVIHEEAVEEFTFDDRPEDIATTLQDLSLVSVQSAGEQELPSQIPTKRTLTRAALFELEPGSSHQTSTIITLGNSNDTDLKYIVRYFRSSCSSAASVSETTVSTPTTTTTYNSASKMSRRRCPVRISFVPVDPDIPLQEQHGGHFDLLLHKLTEDILSCSLDEQNNPAALQRVRALKNYQREVNPGCCLVDDPSNVQTLMSRSDIARTLQSCLWKVRSASGIPVRAPKFVVTDGTESEEVLKQRLAAEALSTPLMVKPLVAAGTKESHLMTIVLKLSALSELPPRSIIQEYVNHNATLFKVYVLGEHVFVYQRPSLPNLPPHQQLSTAAVDALKFDSQRPYPNIADFCIEEWVEDSTTTAIDEDSVASSSDYTPVTSDEIRPVVECLRQNFGLELFGFDILLTPQKEYLVVDVNYFPSYKEVPNFPSLLAHYLTQRVLHQRRQNFT